MNIRPFHPRVSKPCKTLGKLWVLPDFDTPQVEWPYIQWQPIKESQKILRDSQEQETNVLYISKAYKYLYNSPSFKKYSTHLLLFFFFLDDASLTQEQLGLLYLLTDTKENGFIIHLYLHISKFLSIILISIICSFSFLLLLLLFYIDILYTFTSMFFYLDIDIGMPTKFLPTIE